MMKLFDVKEWIREITENTPFQDYPLFNNYYLNGIDASHSIVIYKRNDDLNKMSGFTDLNYSVFPVSLLIHYSQSYSETEDMAVNLYKIILEESKNEPLYINGFKVIKINMLQESPIPSIKRFGVWEQIIEFNIIYQKNEV